MSSFNLKPYQMQLPFSRLLQVALLCFVLILLGSRTAYDHYQSLWLIINSPTNDLTIDLEGIAPPNTNPRAQPDFDIFAWNSFIALNWPAIVPTEDNGFLRGIPDIKKSFANAGPTDLLVWETYKEKREIFNQTKKVGSRQVPTLLPWNAPVEYGILRPADTDIETFTPDPEQGIMRIFHQGRKQLSPFNGLDETAEVGSEVLEATYPDGTPNPVFGRPVGPRVWKGVPSDSFPVLYEVKLNYDYYNYIEANELYLDNTEVIQQKAAAAELRLPLPHFSSARSEKPNG